MIQSSTTPFPENFGSTHVGLCEYVAPRNAIICYCCTFWLWILENVWFLMMPWFSRIFGSSLCHGSICSFSISGYEIRKYCDPPWFVSNYGIFFVRILENLLIFMVPWICLKLRHFLVMDFCESLDLSVIMAFLCQGFENLLIFMVP